MPHLQTVQRKLFANCLCRQQMPHLQIAQRKVLQIVKICESFLPQKFLTVCHLRSSSDPWPDWQPYSQEVVHSVSQNTGSCIIVAWVNVKNRQMCRLQRFNLRVSWASETEQHYLNSEASPVHQITAYRPWMSVASISCSNFRYVYSNCPTVVLLPSWTRQTHDVALYISSTTERIMCTCIFPYPLPGMRLGMIHSFLFAVNNLFTYKNNTGMFVQPRQVATVTELYLGHCCSKTGMWVVWGRVASCCKWWKLLVYCKHEKL